MRKAVLIFLLLAAALVIQAGPVLAIELIEDHQDIEGPFVDGPAVTEACLECHEEVAHDFMQTSHWNWEPMQDVIGKGKVPLGKKNTLNNFCIAISSNWPRCTSCHAGYGWKDASFDFTDENRIDCLVCHDQTGTYKKFPTGAGHPVYEPKEWKGKIWEPLDLASLARSAGKPTRKSCGSCHFSGGGGNNVKHGDLEKSLLKAPRELDVHMSPDGEDFSCNECHTAEKHNIAGNALFVSPGGNNHLECTSCHDDDVHEKNILNWHNKTVACQTCHIPEFARANPTKVWWDWSTAGSKLNTPKDENGMATFINKKGSFKWEKNVVPEYMWYNGVSGQYLLGEKINPEEITRLNYPMGNRIDHKAKIYPFKLMKSVQPYDKVNKVIVVPKLFGKGGYWKTFDWNKAIKAGMASVNQEYSGEYDFAPTNSYWGINHMVAPKEDALLCKDCHAKDGSGRIDWKAMGYEKDPARKRGVSRYELKEAYDKALLD